MAVLGGLKSLVRLWRPGRTEPARLCSAMLPAEAVGILCRWAQLIRGPEDVEV